jgi:hypothetical protein
MTTAPDVERHYGIIKSWNGRDGVVETAAPHDVHFDAASCGSYRPMVGAKVTITIAAGPHAASVEPIARR